MSTRFPTRHAAAILALLAMRPGQPVSKDDIADTLWPDEALDASRRRIREHLFQLRRAIPNGGALIVGEGDYLRLSSAQLVVDIHEFDRLVRIASETDDLGLKSKLLEEADALYAAPLAVELDWPRFDGLRTRYADMHLETLRALSHLHSEVDFDAALRYGHRAVDADPLCEAAHEDLIKLYGLAGRTLEARRQYREMEKLLKKELQTEPSREITQFVAGLSSAKPSGPVPKLLSSLGIPMPSRRAVRAYSVIASVSLLIALISLIAAKPWDRPHVQPPSPEERIAQVLKLGQPVPGESHAERNVRMRAQADEIIELAEGGWRAWWGPDEQNWVVRLQRIDPAIEESLEWLYTHDPAAVIRLTGALSRYWVFPESHIKRETRWLFLARDYRGPVPAGLRARALVGLARYYLVLDAEEARPGLSAAEEANRLYTGKGDRWGQAHSLRYMALHKSYQGRKDLALKDYNAALAIFKERGDEWAQAQTYECMSYLNALDSKGSVTHSDQLGWAIQAAKKYREIRNPLGVTEGIGNLMKLVNSNILVHVRSDVLNAAKIECHAIVHDPGLVRDTPTYRHYWRMIARLALYANDSHLMAESLPALGGNSTPKNGRRFGYIAILLGAYIRFGSLDQHPEDATSMFRSSISRRSFAGYSLNGKEHMVRRGMSMMLDQAVRFALDF